MYVNCFWSAEQRAGWDDYTAEVVRRCGQLCNTSAARLKPGPFLGAVTARVGILSCLVSAAAHCQTPVYLCLSRWTAQA